MAKITTKVQSILERMILDKFEMKREVLEAQLDKVKKCENVITEENKDKCEASIRRVMKQANDDAVKILKAAGLEIGRGGYYGKHIIALFDSDGALKSNWKDYVKPIAPKSRKQQSLEEDLAEYNSKRMKAIDELILRVTLGCKYDEVVEFINNLEV